MPTYRYQLIADIEVDAPNIMAAEEAIMGSSRFTGLPKVRGFGSYVGGVRLPSMRLGEHCRVEVRVGTGKIERVK
jgi:hypothetical protein